MVRKLVCAMFVMTVAISFVMADEFTATITKVDGKNVSFQKYKKSEVKGKKGEKDGPETTLPTTADVKVAKGTPAKGGKVDVGDAIEGGLKSEVFTKIDAKKGLTARITTDADNKNITQILVVGKKPAAE